MSENHKEPEEDLTFKCPSCKQGIISIEKTEYETPDKDKLLIIKFECNKCTYHQNDVIPMTTRMDAGIFTLKVTNEKDLKSKIYRSPSGKLEIPELELIVEPGPSAGFYYTNVEGILLRFEQAVSIYKKNLNKNDPQYLDIEDITRDLQNAINGELNFTLEITDPGGGSYIIAENPSHLTFKKLPNNIEENQ